MTSVLRLYSGPLSMFGAKAEIALREKGLTFELIMVPFVKGDRYEPKHPEVLRINPKGQVPVLIHGTVELFDSTQIFEYLEDAFPDPPLWPRDIKARAEARQLELKSDEIVFMNIARLFGLEETPDDPVAVAARARPTSTMRRWRRGFVAATTLPALSATPTSASSWRSSLASGKARS